MNHKKKIILTVTNDLSTDQRMQRICSSLYLNGYNVELVGRDLSNSSFLDFDYDYKRLRCFFNTGFLFYAEYNLRLFFYLLTQTADAICAVDLDTILPVRCVTSIRKSYFVYDAHEYYSESPELDSRPFVKRIWEKIADFTISKTDLAYTVNNSIAKFLTDRYSQQFEVVRNLPRYIPSSNYKGSFLLYQGVLNEGRGLEQLVTAMIDIRGCVLKIAGGGIVEKQLKKIVEENQLQDRVEFLGVISPKDLKLLTNNALIGFNLLNGQNKNYYYSLANKFFDYMMAGVPSVGMNFPEYRAINDIYGFSILIDQLNPKQIADAVNTLLSDDIRLDQMRTACLTARKVLNWEKEEQKLLSLYSDLFSDSF